LPVRIYSLAKELKLDSKELVDLCPKAGVTGKGSALASLSDEEVAKVKEYLSGGGKPASGGAASAPTSRAVEKPQGPIRRDDYIAPAGTTGRRSPLTPSKPKSAEPKKKPPAEGGKSPGKVAPAIKLAPLPAAPAEPQAVKSDEPQPQKPDIKLPADAIRAGKIGSKPLSEHLRKHDLRRKADEGKEPGTRPAARGKTSAAPPPSGGGKVGEVRGRRGRRAGGTDEGQPGAATPARKGSGLGGREQRQLKRKRSGSGARRGRDESSTPGVRRLTRNRMRRTGTNTAAPRKSRVVVPLPCTIRVFSETIGVPARMVLAKLLGLGTMANINAQLDVETAELLAVELGVDVDFKEQATLEDKVLTTIDEQQDAPESLVPRAPVVTFLGHVDHGKTSLLDRIIGTNVVSGESGGITQHIRAYRVEKDGRPITFVDTPGHEAFTQMRARGANVTDVAVLVVSADDGVMPQTEEAISHAQAAGVPIVVALNKIDLPGVNVDRVLQQLATKELLPSEWGGDTEIVKTSATTGEGIDELLETLLTVAELQDYRANPNRAAVGTCLESEMHEGRGVVAKLLVQRGTLHVGDVLVCGTAYGRIKAMYDTLAPKKTVQEAGPTVPVNVTGLNLAPQAGEHFYVLDEIATAREIAKRREEESRHADLSDVQPHVTLENLFERLDEEEVATLNLILRADTQGSIEAIRKELGKLEHAEVQIKILQATVGGVSEADVHLAHASDAVVIAFNVVPDEGARSLADQTGVQIRRYEVIYQISEDLKAALEGMLKPEKRDIELGRALVLRVFTVSRFGSIAGCRVLSGTIQRSARCRVIRDSRIIGDYAIDSLRREKDDVRDVREGMECGIKLLGFNDVKEGDFLEAYRVEEFARTLDG